MKWNVKSGLILEWIGVEIGQLTLFVKLRGIARVLYAYPMTM